MPLSTSCCYNADLFGQVSTIGQVASGVALAVSSEEAYILAGTGVLRAVPLQVQLDCKQLWERTWEEIQAWGESAGNAETTISAVRLQQEGQGASKPWELLLAKKQSTTASGRVMHKYTVCGQQEGWPEERQSCCSRKLAAAAGKHCSHCHRLSLRVLFSDPWTSWQPQFSTAASWSTSGRVATFEGSGRPSDSTYNLVTFGPTMAKEARFEATVNFKGLTAGIGVFASDQSYYLCALDSRTNQGLSILKFENTYLQQGGVQRTPDAQDVDTKLRMVVSDGLIECFKDGKIQVSVVDTSITTGKFALVTHDASATFTLGAFMRMCHVVFSCIEEYTLAGASWGGHASPTRDDEHDLEVF